jgi:hypothetical protein
MFMPPSAIGKNPDTIKKLNYDCISHIIYLFDLHHVATGIVEGMHY